MRTTKLLAAILVAGLTLSACQQDPDYVLPAIRVASTELNFNADTEQPLEFTATRDWRVRSKPDWVTVTPDQGVGSEAAQRVRITVTSNPNYNREGEIVLSIGLAKATVTISQPGDKGEVPVGTGTLEDPYTVKGAIAAVANLTWTSTTDYQATEEVYVKGKIATVSEAFSAQYGNASFTIKGDTGDEVFTVYRALYLGNKKWTANDTQIKAGDEVIIKGKLMNYQGKTPETVANASFIYSLNGVTEGSGGGGNSGTPSGTGTLADPYNIAGANAAVANLTWTSNDDYQTTDDVFVKGKISRIATSTSNGTTTEQYYTAQFGNASFYISDDGGTSGEFYVFRTLYLENKKWEEGDTQIKVGDEVIICGKLMNYKGNTPETDANKSYLYSLNGVTEKSGGQGSGGGTTTVTYSKVSSIVSGNKYVLIGVKGDKCYAATPLASDKTYGRLNGKETTVSNDKIFGDMASYEFTFTSVEGGFTIAMPDGRMLAASADYDGTFQIGDNYDHVFTAVLENGLFKIVHKATGKTVYHGGGTYTNFSIATSVPDDGTLLQLYLKDNN